MNIFDVDEYSCWVALLEIHVNQFNIVDDPSRRQTISQRVKLRLRNNDFEVAEVPIGPSQLRVKQIVD